MKNYRAEIREATRNMNRQEKVEYIFTYYWYHILGLCALVGLVIFLIVHIGYADPEKAFTCVIVNQAIDIQQDEELAEAFAEYVNKETEVIEIDSNYNFSYTGHELQDVNESSYEKFFLRWANGELDAIILSEDFLEFCLEMEGEFCDLESFETGDLELYGTSAYGIRLSSTIWSDLFEEGDEGELILVFPSLGESGDLCQKFLDYLQG